MKENKIWISIIYLIVIAMYNLAVFLIFDERNNIFWISYGFVTATFIIGYVIFSWFSNVNIKKQFMKLPLISAVLGFQIIELIVSLVFMILKKNIDVKFIILAQAILLLLCVVILVTLISKEADFEKSDKTVKTGVGYINKIRIDIELMLEQCSNKKVQKSMQELLEIVRYSDPITDNSVAELEALIGKKVNELKQVYKSEDTEKIVFFCKDIILLIEERNKKLIIQK